LNTADQSALTRFSTAHLRWEEDKGWLLAVVIAGETNHAQQLFLHEEEEDEKGDELLSDDEPRSGRCVRGPGACSTRFACLVAFSRANLSQTRPRLPVLYSSPFR
jgi:hypothetical protein